MRINSDLYPIAVQSVFTAFAENNAEIRACGGCIRDVVLGVTPKDWDMCTPVLPVTTMAILEAYGFKPFDLSNGHGTISVIIDGETIEITTLRIDTETDGRFAKVHFTTNWELDAERRDFTWNAMSADGFGHVFDYFGGVADLNSNRIVFVGWPEKRIEEDYLRILRYFRFAARFQMFMDPFTLTTINRLAPGLTRVSGERIWMEMKKILETPNNALILDAMRTTSVLPTIGIK